MKTPGVGLLEAGEIPAKEAKRREYFRKTVVNKGVSNATDSEKKKIGKMFTRLRDGVTQ